MTSTLVSCRNSRASAVDSAVKSVCVPQEFLQLGQAFRFIGDKQQCFHTRQLPVPQVILA